MKSLKTVVQSMTASQIIYAMIDALENPVCPIQMSTFGTIVEDFEDGSKKVCFGCAATNTIAKLHGWNYEELFNQISGAIASPTRYAYILDQSYFEHQFLRHFENSINNLRLGEIEHYNIGAEYARFATIDVDLDLPELRSNFNDVDLKPFKELARLQEEFEKKLK